jgi:hypothetical protein
MTANVEVARQAEAPGARLQPRPASRQPDGILIVILLAAAALSAQQAEAAGVP